MGISLFGAASAPVAWSLRLARRLAPSAPCFGESDFAKNITP